MPEQRDVELTIHNWQANSAVTLAGEKLAKYTSMSDLESAKQGSYFDKNTNKLKVKLAWSKRDIQLNIAK